MGGIRLNENEKQRLKWTFFNIIFSVFVGYVSGETYIALIFYGIWAILGELIILNEGF